LPQAQVPTPMPGWLSALAMIAVLIPVAVNSPSPLASVRQPPAAVAPVAAAAAPLAAPADPVLCTHCGRTASNGLVCIGMCVADSGY